MNYNHSYNSPERIVSPPLITAFVSQVCYNDDYLHNTHSYVAGQGSDINLRRRRTEALGDVNG